MPLVAGLTLLASRASFTARSSLLINAAPLQGKAGNSTRAVTIPRTAAPPFCTVSASCVRMSARRRLALRMVIRKTQVENFEVP